jgi:hypothetical protein
MTTFDQRRYAKAKAAGLCIRCRKRPKTKTSVICEECKVQFNSTRKKRRARNKANGLCPCGNELTVLDGGDCLMCIEDKAKNREWR